MVTETKATHTPGPWKVGQRSEGPYPFTVEGRDRLVAMVEYEPDDATSANARLIAAAPEMLEAIREILWGDRDTGEEMAREAFAKAEGREP